MTEFKGQAALVTGAGRGIGKAIALKLAREGADVAVADLNKEWAEATAAEIAKFGRKSCAAGTDVRDQAAVQALVSAAVGTLGKLDILVNNAGTSKAKPFLEITKEEWDAQISVHMSGTFFCSQAAARHMRERNYGRIVCITSVSGLMGPIDLAAYGAAKAGIIGLVRSMSLELADHGITVNGIAPGPIDTDLLRSAWPKDVYEERSTHIPVGRLGRVEEIAHAVAFYASPNSGFISGTILPVDGGSVAAGAYMVEKHRRRKVAKAVQ